MATCGATVTENCCWVPGVGLCPHFDPSLKDGFCSLRAELGDWSLVHRDPRYAPQRAVFEAFPTPLCGDYPGDESCGVCGMGS
jgi:hypothetical protein